jgi:hypothetical protein
VHPVTLHAHGATVQTLKDSTPLHAHLCAPHTLQRSKKLSLTRQERAARDAVRAEHNITLTTRGLRRRCGAGRRLRCGGAHTLFQGELLAALPCVLGSRARKQLGTALELLNCGRARVKTSCHGVTSHQ